MGEQRPLFSSRRETSISKKAVIQIMPVIQIEEACHNWLSPKHFVHLVTFYVFYP